METSTEIMMFLKVITLCYNVDESLSKFLVFIWQQRFSVILAIVCYNNSPHKI